MGAEVPSTSSKTSGEIPGSQFITIVSGLPRSGTSMMMSMLKAGGMDLVTDNIRKADDDNPRGYYEYERAKKIKEDASWLDECKGRAVKMVSNLLFDLPSDRKYRVLFMRRQMEEMLESQRILLRRQGKETGLSDQDMAETFEKHLRHVEDWLARQPCIEVFFLDYSDVIRDPKRYAILLNQLLGGRLDVSKMASVVDPALYRHRKCVSSSQ
jgi:hypothetical protein